MNMMVHRYLVGQMNKPRGIVGKFILGCLWNVRNARLNEVTLARLELKEADRVLDVGLAEAICWKGSSQKYTMDWLQERKALCLRKKSV